MSAVKPGFLKELLPDDAPNAPSSWQSIMEDIDKIIMPGITHWQHPNFCGFFCITTSYPSIVAEMLINAINAMGVTWVSV